jgi:hypothetical protein
MPMGGVKPRRLRTGYPTSWPVVGDVSPAVGLKDFNAPARQQLPVGHHVLALRIPAQGKHRGMLDQQQHIVDPRLLAQRTHPLLQGQRRGVIQTAQIDQGYGWFRH